MGKKEEIRILGNDLVDKEECRCGKQAGDQVEWISQAGEFTVRFPRGRSPFEKEVFTVRPGQSTVSGVPVGDLGRYPYRVESSAGGGDPIIIID